jgi:hypothetical protein
MLKYVTKKKKKKKKTTGCQSLYDDQMKFATNSPHRVMNLGYEFTVLDCLPFYLVAPDYES